MLTRRSAAAAAALLAIAAACAPTASGVRGSAPRAAAPASQGGLHGRLEQPSGLRLLRVWGTPEQRGYAHGRLLAADIVKNLGEEFVAQFAQRPELLDQARAALPRLIEYPEEIQRELDALWRGVRSQQPDLYMPAFGRAFDRRDLLLANAMDVFGLMGCSSFTVWGEEVAGGGVMTARNSDWHVTGAHIVDAALLIVQEYADGRAVASFGWPGYVGAVSGVSADGVAAYLHVGSARQSMPEPSSWPAAAATRMVLAARDAGDARLQRAQELIEYTSPPAGFLTHVVVPAVPASGVPAVVFEADARRCVPGAAQPGPLVVTNHFRTRRDGVRAGADSVGRERTLQRQLTRCVEVGDRRVDAGDAWRMLSEVAKGGGSYFGTLHSLVFRHEPWLFEARLAELREGAVVAAPQSDRRYRLTREQVFGRR
ncbi:MAG: C45 family peptidase [Planctomycetota bacterium]|nr:C45 family peptidase [Planctomycetota bacterium]